MPKHQREVTRSILSMGCLIGMKQIIDVK